MIPEEGQELLFLVDRNCIESLSESIGGGIDRIGDYLADLREGFCG